MTTQINNNKKDSGAEDKQRAAVDRGDLPVGNASPRAIWPIYVLGAVWLLWIGFLVYLAATSGATA